MKIRGTDFILFPVRDIPRAVAFYRDILHLPMGICSAEHGWAEFDAGNVTLALQASKSTETAGGETRLALAVDNVDAAHTELTEIGLTVPERIEDHGVCRVFEIRDPDGNRILLHHRQDGTYGQTPLPHPLP